MERADRGEHAEGQRREAAAPAPALDGRLGALQDLIGNRATSRLIARQHRAPPVPEHAGLDVAPLLAAQVPELLPLIHTAEIDAMQRRYDTQAYNKEVDRRWTERDAYLRSRYIDPDGSMGRAAQTDLPETRPEDGPLSFSIPTEQVLSDDILAEPPRNKALENAFRKLMYAELMKDPTVRVSIEVVFRGGAEIERERRANPNVEPAYTANAATLTSGRRSLPHTLGRVHFWNLVATTFAKEYDQQVVHNPAVAQLWLALGNLENQVGLMYGEHEERIQKNKDHPVVRRIAEFLGEDDLKELMELAADVKAHPERGTWDERLEELSSDCPELKIWDRPHAEIAQAKAVLAEDFELGSLAFMRAQAAAEKAARLYEKYEAKVMKGAGMALKALTFLKTAGTFAAAAMPGMGIVESAVMAASYSLAQQEATWTGEAAFTREGPHIDAKRALKDAGMAGAMALFSGLTQGAFAERLAFRIEARWGEEMIAKYGMRAMDLQSSKFIVAVGAAATSAPYNLAASKVLERIVYGRTEMPKSVDDLADMVLKEVRDSVGMATMMHGIHSAFEEPAGGPKEEPPGGRAGHEDEHPGRAAPGEPAGTTGATGGGGAASPAVKPEVRFAELAGEAHASPRAADAVIDHFGSWEQAMAHVVRGGGDLGAIPPPGREQLMVDLLARRQGVVDDVGTRFSGKLDPGEGGPGSAAQLTMTGADAGLRVAQATAYLDAAHPGWQARYKISVGIEPGRARSIAEAAASLPREMQTELARHQSGAQEAIRAARAARVAPPAERAGIVNRLPEVWHDLANSLIDFAPQDITQYRLEFMTQSDRAFQRIDPKAPAAERMAEIREAINKQLLAEAVESMPPKAAGPASPGEQPDATDRAVQLLPEETVMSPGRATSGTDARTMYRNSIAESPNREAAIYRNTITGEYIIVQGERDVAQVAPGEAPRGRGKAQRWKEILDKGSDIGRWELQAHSHPVEADGFVHPVDRYPSGAQGDMGAMVAEARAAGHARSSRIDYRLESGPSHTDFGFDPSNEKPYWIDVQGLPGMPRRFGSMESYHEFLETLGVTPGDVPPEMSGKTPAQEIESRAPASPRDLREDILDIFAERQERYGGPHAREREGARGPAWPRDPMALPEYQSEAQSAQAAFASLPGERGKKTVARVEGEEPVESGEADTPGYEGKAETVGAVGAEGLGAGHEGERHIFDRRNDPGSYGRTHAERQAAQKYPNRAIGVSKPMCSNCVRYFGRLAASRDIPQFVRDPLVTHVFMPDGRHLTFHTVRPSTRGAGQSAVFRRPGTPR